MTNIMNAFRQELTERQAPLPEFVWKTGPRLAELVGAKDFHFDVRSLDPGKFSFPYHFHRNSEELFVILSGGATLRGPDGFREVGEGDLIFFGRGEEGAHQLYNHTDRPCLYLDIRSAAELDVCEYPDSGKINLLPYREIYETSSRVDYYRGEERVREHWPEDLMRGSGA